MKLIGINRYIQEQQGRTLIELMISLTIGLLISGAALSLFLSSNSSFRLQDENSRMHEDGNFTLLLLGKNIVQSGFSHITASSPNQAMHNVTALSEQAFRVCEHGFSATSKGDFSCAGSSGGFPAMEVIYGVDKSYQANTGAGADCNGQEPKFNLNGAPFGAGEARYVINRFFVTKKKGDAYATLYCAGNGNTVSQPILSNVENFVLSLGLDSDSDQTPDGYVAASTAIDNWKTVIGVKICFQTVSDNKVLRGTVQKYFNCAGEEKSSADRHLRRVFRSVFALRNNVASTVY